MKDRLEDNAAVEIHDSELQSIERDGDAVLAVFSAYVHRSSGVPGVDSGTGWSQTLHLRFRQGRVTGTTDRLPMELLDGYLEVSGVKSDNMIPIPITRTGHATLTLCGWNDAHVVFEGEDVDAALIGTARYIEDFSATRRSKE